MLAELAVAAVLKGTVMMGPITPVCQAGVPCSRPAARVTLTFTHGSRAFTAKTTAAGTYALTLPPGLYSVTASAGMRIAPAQLTVTAGTHRRNFSIDTGIR